MPLICYNGFDPGGVSIMKRKIISLVVCLMLIVSMYVAPISASAAGTYKILKVNTNANLRNPDDYTDVLDYLKAGTKVLWTGKTKKAFLLVTTTSGKTGYIYKPYLSEYGAVAKSQVYKTRSACKIYKKPSTSSSKAGSVGKGRYVLVYATKGGWAYVKTTSGKGGFMKVSNLTK